MSQSESGVLTEYDKVAPIVGEFAAKLTLLLTDLVAESGIVVHSIAHRLKSRRSLQEKLARASARYATLADVTDIAGIRVICFFANDVDAVSKIVQREFAMDAANSVDKGALLDPDRFGYLSLHHVVGLSPARAKLPEWRRFPTIKAEIQLRSVLQHSWAEVEHDLGYKTRVEIPRHIRRRFSRVAGLLELADQEFIGIKSELAAYAKEVPEAVAASPDKVLLDRASLLAFIKSDERVRRLDAAIAAHVRLAVFQEFDDTSEVLRRLELAGVTTIAGAGSLLDENEGRLLAFVESILRLVPPPPGSLLASGVSLTVAAYIPVLRTFGDAQAEEYLRLTASRLNLQQLRVAYNMAFTA